MSNKKRVWMDEHFAKMLKKIAVEEDTSIMELTKRIEQIKVKKNEKKYKRLF